MIRATRNDLRRAKRAALTPPKSTSSQSPNAAQQEPNAKPSNALRDALTELSSGIPHSNGIHHFSKIEATVAVVGNDQMAEEFRNTFNRIIRLNPLTLDSQLAADHIDAVWLANCDCNGSCGWHSRTGGSDAGLSNLLEIAKRQGIPSVLSVTTSRLDPHILEAARIANLVLVSNELIAQEVRDRVDGVKIRIAEIAVDPLLHNPVGSQRHNLRSAFFSGEIPKPSTESARGLNVIFKSLKNASALVVGRLEPTARNALATQYVDCAIEIPGVASQADIAKLFSYIVNVEHDVDSPSPSTAAANLQAQGVPVLSNYSVGVFNHYPWVRIVPERCDIERLFAEEELLHAQLRAQYALHSVMSNGTQREAFSRLFEELGLPTAKSRPESVLVIGSGDWERVQESFDRQIYSNATLVSEADAAARDIEKFGYVAYIDAEKSYGPYYLQGRVNAFKYTNSTFVTQDASYIGGRWVDGQIHEYADAARDRSTTVVSTAHPDAVNFILGRLEELRGEGYLVDPYEVDFDRFLRNKSDVLLGAPLLSVIVPVYNNGTYLLAKALPSLQSNAAWSRMEILLIDDGSDSATLEICSTLAGIYPNIKFFSFADGGSGSASRPRNYGLERATGELITFLDPDNEISLGGYDTLIAHFDAEIRKNADVEFVSAYQAKIAVKRSYTGRHAKNNVVVISDFNENFFSQGDFPVISTQAAVLSRGLIERSGLRFVERAVGQDTLFGWEVILNAKAGVFVDDAFLIYYAERSDSVTNVVGAKYFSRVLINEVEKERVLREHGILEIYKRTHMPKFIKTWYLPRLGRVPSNQYGQARADLEKIVQLYGHTLSEYE
ncbi:MAG: glycosyltransferase family 2 protein [Yaniella sp.]|uniref:glycosyltransferase family 2 protein n=1 Tax=Yaniella sp. TaxID=2773929 RepID=UPI003F9C5C54